MAKKSKPAALDNDSVLEVKLASMVSNGSEKTNKREDQRTRAATVAPEDTTYTTLVVRDGCRGLPLTLPAFSTLSMRAPAC
jgi:hypothetical protein